MDLRGRLRKDGADDVGPVWSPDGSRIAFESYTGAISDIYIVDLDGQRQQVTHTLAIDSSPSWSPDGTRIAFLFDDAPTPEIYAVNVDRSNLIRVTDDPAVDKNPVWSPFQ